MSMRDEVERFTLTAQHVTLLRAAKVGWDYVEFGAPALGSRQERTTLEG